MAVPNIYLSTDGMLLSSSPPQASKGKKVTYRILVKIKHAYHKVGNIIIDRFAGCIFYVPSQNKCINSSDSEIENKLIDHVAWHSSGRVHIKDASGESYVVEEGEGVVNPKRLSRTRQTIKDTGYQTILWDTIMDITTLPAHKKKADNLDVVFAMDKHSGPVQFSFSMVSGKHILKAETGQKTPVHRVASSIQKERIIGDIVRRTLGWESGNADKLLQYALYKYTGEGLKEGRRLKIHPTSSISAQ